MSERRPAGKKKVWATLHKKTPNQKKPKKTPTQTKKKKVRQKNNTI